MTGLTRTFLGIPQHVVVVTLTTTLVGLFRLRMVSDELFPVWIAPAVQALGFQKALSASSASQEFTSRTEPRTSLTSGAVPQFSRSFDRPSIVCSRIQDDVHPNGELTQLDSLAFAAMPNLPSGTLPPVVLPLDPTSRTSIAIIPPGCLGHIIAAGVRRSLEMRTRQEEDAP
jgi:hypothetical protein